MANNWNIPSWLEQEVRNRDKACVYCGCDFVSPKISVKSSPSWEHIINDVTISTIENIALCCIGCNASKGAKLLSQWLESEGAKRRGVSQETLAPVVLAALTT